MMDKAFFVQIEKLVERLIFSIFPKGILGWKMIRFFPIDVLVESNLIRLGAFRRRWRVSFYWDFVQRSRRYAVYSCNDSSDRRPTAIWIRLQLFSME